jgi:segregation and condensation protein A
MTEPTGPKGPVKVGPGARPASEEPARERADAYMVRLPEFEGPLDLLLHLIQKHELDIRDIPIGFITEKYLEYIEMMQQLSIDIASEYLLMAATLAHMKSKTLLPPSADDSLEEGVEGEEEDPRAELVRRLLEYQKYKLAAEQLGSRVVLGRDAFGRGAAPPEPEGPAPLAPLSMFKLIDALESVIERFKQTGEHLVDFERITISDRINQLSDVLRARGTITFEALFEGDRSRADVIVTFLALLEMTKLRLTRIWQDQPYEPIFIELAVRDDEPLGEPGEVEEGVSEAPIAAPEAPDEPDVAAAPEAVAEVPQAAASEAAEVPQAGEVPENEEDPTAEAGTDEAPSQDDETR